MKSTTKFLIVLYIVLSTIAVFSQVEKVFYFTLPPFRISQIEKGKVVKYGFEKDRNLIQLSDGFLAADPERYQYAVRLSDIEDISIRNGFSTFGGAKYGGFIGGGLGLIFGILNSVINKPKFAEIALVIPGLVGAGFLGGALIGGLLGSLNPNYDAYEKFSRDQLVRKEQLRKIFHKYDLNRSKKM